MEWIKVSEKLPEFTGSSETLKWSEDVIICVLNQKKEHNICFGYYTSSDSWCYDYGEPLYKGEYITHWMPLPNPPESC